MVGMINVGFLFRRMCKIIKVISPASFKQQNGRKESTENSDDSDSVICLDDLPKVSPKKKK